jgi:hypothetical protein
MDDQRFTHVVLALSLTACPLGDPNSTTSDGGEAAEDSSGTSGPIADLPPADTETSTSGDGDGDPGDGDGDATETGDPVLRWAALDVDSAFVGWLSTPGPDAVFDHADVFDPVQVEMGSARDLFLTLDGLDVSGEYGFMLVKAGVSFTTLGHDTVSFTGPGCTGTPHDHIASHSDTSVPLSWTECTDAVLDQLADQIIMHYPADAVFDSVVDLRWPGAAGQIVSTQNLSQFYLLPREQEWPEMLTAVSERLADGTCVDLAAPVEMCAVRFIDTGWTPAEAPGGYSLAELPWE